MSNRFTDKLQNDQVAAPIREQLSRAFQTVEGLIDRLDDRVKGLVMTKLEDAYRHTSGSNDVIQTASDYNDAINKPIARDTPDDMPTIRTTSDANHKPVRAHR